MGWLKPAVRATIRRDALFFHAFSPPHALSLSLSLYALTQESLLEPKGMWDAHRDPPPDGPVPEPAEGVVAAGQTVQGVRIGAAGALEILELDLEARKSKDCLPEEFVLDTAKFDFVPIALLLGVPLMFQRLTDIPTEGDGAEELRYETKMYMYKLMTVRGAPHPLFTSSSAAPHPLPPLPLTHSPPTASSCADPGDGPSADVALQRRRHEAASRPCMPIGRCGLYA